MIRHGLPLLLLTVALVVCYAIGGALSGLARAASPDGAPPPLLVVPIVGWVAAALYYLVARARRGGWPMVGAVFLAFFGLNTLSPQLESLFFLQQQLPDGMVSRILLNGAIVAVLFSPVVVWASGRLTPSPATTVDAYSWFTPDWLQRYAGLAVAYAALYLLFGYFVAWRDPVVREYYNGITPAGFFPHLAWMLSDQPGVFVLQLFRGLLYLGLVLPAVRLFQRGPGESALVVALLCTMGAGQLLLPNPFMPEAVRMTHLWEILSSNALFGLLTGWVLARALSSDEAPTPQPVPAVG